MSECQHPHCCTLLDSTLMIIMDIGHSVEKNYSHWIFILKKKYEWVPSKNKNVSSQKKHSYITCYVRPVKKL